MAKQKIIKYQESHWVRNDSGIYFCEFCKNEAYWDTENGQQTFEYCPYCGSKMTEDKLKIRN